MRMRSSDISPPPAGLTASFWGTAFSRGTFLGRPLLFRFDEPCDVAALDLGLEPVEIVVERVERRLERRGVLAREIAGRNILVIGRNGHEPIVKLLSSGRQ